MAVPTSRNEVLIDVYLISELPNTDHGRALFDWLSGERGTAVKNMVKAEISNEFFNKDVRYLAGQIELIDKILALPEKYKKTIEKQEKA